MYFVCSIRDIFFKNSNNVFHIYIVFHNMSKSIQDFADELKNKNTLFSS